MTKKKTVKAAAKRFRITKTGKVMRGRQHTRHRRAHKSRTQIDRYGKPARVSPEFEKIIKSMLQ